jgi:hypothetical protein
MPFHPPPLDVAILASKIETGAAESEAVKAKRPRAKQAVFMRGGYSVDTWARRRKKKTLGDARSADGYAHGETGHRGTLIDIQTTGYSTSLRRSCFGIFRGRTCSPECSLAKLTRSRANVCESFGFVDRLRSRVALLGVMSYDARDGFRRGSPARNNDQWSPDPAVDSGGARLPGYAGASHRPPQDR